MHEGYLRWRSPNGKPSHWSINFTFALQDGIHWLPTSVYLFSEVFITFSSFLLRIVWECSLENECGSLRVWCELMALSCLMWWFVQNPPDGLPISFSSWFITWFIIQMLHCKPMIQYNVSSINWILSRLPVILESCVIFRYIVRSSAFFKSYESNMK